MIRYSLSGYDCGVSPSNDGSLVSYSEARAEIERLEKEVARLKGYGIDAVSAAYDRGSKSAWNDAIEAAAQVANDYDHYEIEGVIRALKRSHE